MDSSKRTRARGVFGSLALLVVVLATTAVALESRATAVAAIGLLGIAAFATVPPLQLRVLEKAGAAGQSLASSLNIAAFNLGNALGAWLGGVTIDQGPGLTAVPLVAALVTAGGLGIALWSVALERRAAALADPRARLS